MISVGSEVQILPGPPMLLICQTLDLSNAGFGGVAQLGEHLLCKQGVVGSSPITSTTAVDSRFGIKGWGVEMVGDLECIAEKRK